mmetsp:Transcript_24570/g.48832  ORF Transcript_24570/g.48832 Transcript_24570/m.48832 type:complete len:224 (-) Transcript_24570:1266-1937(-)
MALMREWTALWSLSMMSKGSTCRAPSLLPPVSHQRVSLADLCGNFQGAVSWPPAPIRSSAISESLWYRARWRGVQPSSATIEGSPPISRAILTISFPRPFLLASLLLQRRCRGVNPCLSCALGSLPLLSIVNKKSTAGPSSLELSRWWRGVYRNLSSAVRSRASPGWSGWTPRSQKSLSMGRSQRRVTSKTGVLRYLSSLAFTSAPLSMRWLAVARSPRFAAM